jgi:GNAT superfamily N-acetyltransferase
MGVVKRFTVGSGGFLGEVSLYTNNYTSAQPTYTLYMSDFHVHPMRRELGWGTLLLAECTSWADAEGAAVITYARPFGRKRNKFGTQRARAEEGDLERFYKSFGFRRCAALEQPYTLKRPCKKLS